jgi:hypothetical protein
LVTGAKGDVGIDGGLRPCDVAGDVDDAGTWGDCGQQLAAF